MSVQTNKQLYLNQLEELGLSDEEATVYLLLLEYGPKSHLEISRETSLNRSKIYRLSTRLMRMKLLEESETSRGKKLIASPPANLELLIKTEEHILETKKRKLPDLVDTLTSISSAIPGKFEIINYKGEEGLKQVLLNELKSKEVYCFTDGLFYKLITKKFRESILEESIRRRIRYKILSNNKDDSDNFWRSPLQNNYEYREIDTEIIEIKQNLRIHGNTISITCPTNDPISAIEIISDEYSTFMHQIFNFFWNLVE